MSNPLVAEIKMFAGNFAPRGYAFCNGQIMPIAQNTALFSLLGTTYGGDGRTTFALPDLRGRTPIHSGGSAGPGLQLVDLGEQAGTPSVTLTVAQLPAHSHTQPASGGAGNKDTPIGNIPAGNSKNENYADASSATGALASTSLSGSSQPVSLLQPYLGVNFIIAIEGIFPSRN